MNLAFVINNLTALSEFLPFAKYAFEADGSRSVMLAIDPDTEAALAGDLPEYVTTAAEHVILCGEYGDLTLYGKFFGRWRLTSNALDFVRRMRNARAFLQTHEIDVVCLYEDRNVLLTAPLLAAANSMSLPSVVMPIAVGDPAFYASYRGDNFNCGPGAPFLNRIVASMFPDQVFRMRARQLLFYEAYETVLLKSVGALPGNPWVNGGGKSTVVLLQGEAIKDQYVGYGLPPAKAVVTGQFSHDRIFENLSNRVEIKKRLDAGGSAPGKPIVLLALPQLAEHKVMSWEDHWALIDRTLDALESVDCQVYVSLHPKMVAPGYQKLRERNITVADESLREIICAADVFVAGFESTLHWASMCGIPSIFLEYAGTNYTLKSLTGVVRARSAGELASAATRLLEDDDERKAAIRDMREKAAGLSVLDGRCGERILQVLRDQAAGKS